MQLARQFRPKVLEADFGDGYSLAIADGIQNMRETIRVTWSRLSHVDRKAVTDFFEARKGAEPFLWTPPRETVAKRWRCREWEVGYPSQMHESVTATFTQAIGT